jgi:uncharacterized protein YdaU (DUF1376 family)
MAKDPAFLFYPGDFATGTQFFTNEQVGKYMRLLMAQHQHGHLPEKHMIFICGSYDKDIFSKFKQDSAGLWYNERLEIEIIKRKKYVESRSKNKEGKTKTKNIFFSYDLHMENENRNRNKDVLINTNGVEKFSEQWFAEVFDDIYLDGVKMTFKHLDVENEVKIFKLRVRGSPSKYDSRDTGGIRQAFIYQLNNSHGNRNGTKKTVRRADATIEQPKDFGNF